MGASVYMKMTICKSYKSCNECQVFIDFTQCENQRFTDLFHRKTRLADGATMAPTVALELACLVALVGHWQLCRMLKRSGLAPYSSGSSLGVPSANVMAIVLVPKNLIFATSRAST